MAGRGKGCRWSGGLPAEDGSVDDADPRVAAAVALDQVIEIGGVGGVQPDATMRCRRAQPPDIAGAVNGVTAIENTE